MARTNASKGVKKDAKKAKRSVAGKANKVIRKVKKSVKKADRKPRRRASFEMESDNYMCFEWLGAPIWYTNIFEYLASSLIFLRINKF